MSTILGAPLAKRGLETIAIDMPGYGMTRVGHRRIIPVTGGTITGEFKGVILAGGADWQTVRADGSIEIDGRYSARSHDGELLYIRARGVRSGDPAVLESLLRGEPRSMSDD